MCVLSMIKCVFKLTNFIPKYAYYSIFDIPYEKLFEEGKRMIFIDIDNTIVGYDTIYPPKEVNELINHIKKIGFNIMIISNNSKKRAKIVADSLGVDFVYRAFKPSKCGFKKAIKKSKSNKNEIISIGDQLLTDIWGSSRVGIDSILVHIIKKSTEKWYTKINRRIENKIINKIKVKYYDDYQKIVDVRGTE